MNDLSEFVILSGTTLTTDSRRVAKHFRKLHKNVLRAYDELDCDEEFNRLNFEPVEELDAKGESRRTIRMTKDGFVFLVMGFQGKEAAKVKIAYIRAFNRMSDQLQSLSMSLWEQRLDLEKRDATSFAWAQFGSRCMLQRKQEKPRLCNERHVLDDRMQPPLFVVAREEKKEAKHAQTA